MVTRVPLIKQQIVPTLELTHLLRRRKTNLKDFMSVNSISTYDELTEKCVRLGVVPPSKESVDLILSPQVAAVVAPKRRTKVKLPVIEEHVPPLKEPND